MLKCGLPTRTKLKVTGQMVHYPRNKIITQEIGTDFPITINSIGTCCRMQAEITSNESVTLVNAAEHLFNGGKIYRTCLTL